MNGSGKEEKWSWIRKSFTLRTCRQGNRSSRPDVANVGRCRLRRTTSLTFREFGLCVCLILKSKTTIDHVHGFAVDIDSLPESDVQITHINLNDQTLEGFRHKRFPLFCVQYHPEASPGPHDSRYLFEEFTSLMTQHRAAEARTVPEDEGQKLKAKR